VQESTNVNGQYEHMVNAYNETVEGYKEIKDMTKGGKKHPVKIFWKGSFFSKRDLENSVIE